MGKSYLHNPVLLREVISFLNPAPGQIIVDATIGGAGHSEQILQKIIPGGMLIGIDRDEETLRLASERLKPFEGSFKLINKNFKHLKETLKDIGVEKVNGIIFDLGISSIQMEAWQRGFSIKNDGPLDMRMDRNQGLTAKDLVNRLSEMELSDTIRELGEERFHRRIAKRIVEERKKKEISTTAELTEVILRSIPYRHNKYKIHPATRTFQALRIRVNDELGSISQALRESLDVMEKLARVCVISFHSLEDRIVKNSFKEFKAEGVLNILTKKPLTPDENEVISNPRSRSAKLRVGERL
ncbi:MAG: 16S rRNA (cytosine(1402)-N(4))-methyltransferase RsmH [Candidatus Omnitrophota bacterium]|nr:16S rRNA (cytosine(1402)-N(4))-methyltransferase RsmH [Candidatus Omnitrophota bacterium]